MADKQQTARRPAARTFNDAGTGQRFEKGATFGDDVPDGAYANYVAAGLVEPEPEKAGATKGAGKADA